MSLCIATALYCTELRCITPNRLELCIELRIYLPPKWRWRQPNVLYQWRKSDAGKEAKTGDGSAERKENEEKNKN